MMKVTTTRDLAMLHLSTFEPVMCFTSFPSLKAARLFEKYLNFATDDRFRAAYGQDEPSLTASTFGTSPGRMCGHLKAVMKGTHLDMARRYSIAITHFHEMCADVKDSAHGCFPHNPTLYCNTAMLKAIETFPHELVELRNLEDLQR